MKFFSKVLGPFCHLALFCAALLVFRPCQAHDWAVHEDISQAAYQSSGGASNFLNAVLADPGATLYASPPQLVNDGASPMGWLDLGSMMEDEEKYPPGRAEERTMDHFYTVTPLRTPGHPIGLTDWSEPSVLGSIFRIITGTTTTNSFGWATLDGIIGPIDVGSNVYRWKDARGYQFAALTNAALSDRNTNIAMMMYTLGHVLHLNQDLTSPDHTRDANHFSTAYFEDYGNANYTGNAQWFTNNPHGWPYWQSNGFSKLLDFWDRGLYTNGSSVNLVRDAGGTAKLGLAEFTSGNFLGETALYRECYNSNSIHYFPLPSLLTSTSYSNNSTINALLVSGVRTVFLRGNRGAHRIYVDKQGDGVTFTNHSFLRYLGVATALRSVGGRLPMSPPVQAVSVSINDTNVLQQYHNILVPKAVEYSAGILDYFFRGTLGVGFSTDGTNNLIITNTSSQDFASGTFHLFYDDTSGNRSELTGTNFTTEYSDSLAAGDYVEADAAFPTNATNYVLIYQGTIGTSNGTNADPVDTGISIATTSFVISPLWNIVWGTPEDLSASGGTFSASSLSTNSAQLSVSAIAAPPGGAGSGEVNGQQIYIGPTVNCNLKVTVSTTAEYDYHSPWFGWQATVTSSARQYLSVGGGVEYGVDDFGDWETGEYNYPFTLKPDGVISISLESAIGSLNSSSQAGNATIVFEFSVVP